MRKIIITYHPMRERDAVALLTAIIISWKRKEKTLQLKKIKRFSKIHKSLNDKDLLKANNSNYKFMLQFYRKSETNDKSFVFLHLR